MRKRNLVIILLLALIIGGLFLVSFLNLFEINSGSEKPDNPPTTGAEIEAPKQTIETISERINSLSPVDSEPGSAWHLKRVGFVDGDNFYVEYTDGALNRRLLLRNAPPDTKKQFKVVGFFRPGQDLWKLVQGENPYFGTPVEIYEKTNNDQWEKVS